MSDKDSATDVLDKSVIASLRELQEPGDTDILEEIGVLFIKHAPGKIAAMKKAASEGDAKALQVAAHSPQLQVQRLLCGSYACSIRPLCLSPTRQSR